MSRPIQILPTVERWDCHQCGNCCRGSIIPLSEEDLSRLKAQKWDEHPELRGQATIVRQGLLAADYRLAQRADGSCVFLTPAGLCRIHVEHGEEAKPLVCRMYPLQLVLLEGVAHLTLRRSCPSAAADDGRPLADHLPQVKQLARAGQLTDRPVRVPPLKAGESRGWPLAMSMLKALSRLMKDERFPPVRRLVHGLIFCNLIDRARTNKLDDRGLQELLSTLEPLVVDEATPLFADRQPPSAWAGMLFRLTAAEYMRLHPRFSVRPGWGQRLRLLRAAVSIARGKSQVPVLISDYPVATFDQLEQPLGRLEPDVLAPLGRFLETTAASYQYALAERGTWSIVESFRALALAYPIGLWLLRASSAGQPPTRTEAIDIVTALDRGQGYAPLLAGWHRSRLNLLARQGELERLIAWYAR